MFYDLRDKLAVRSEVDKTAASLWTRLKQMSPESWGGQIPSALRNIPLTALGTGMVGGAIGGAVDGRKGALRGAAVGAAAGVGAGLTVTPLLNSLQWKIHAGNNLGTLSNKAADRLNSLVRMGYYLRDAAVLGGAASAVRNRWDISDSMAAYTGHSTYITDKKALGLGEMRMNVLGEASAARQAAEAARVQPAPTVADTVKATAEQAYTRKKASPAVNPKFFKRMLSTRGGKAALIGGAGLAALGLGGAGYAGYRKYSKPEVPWYLTQGGTAGIGALAGGLMGAGAGYGAAGRPGAGAGGMLGALGGAAAGYYGNDMIRGYAGY